MKQIHLGGKSGSVIGNYALVDDQDYEWLNQWKWYAAKHGKRFYAQRHKAVDGRKQSITMHRVILGLTDPKILGDHEDGNGLNNQTYNLRKATSQQNCMNRKSHDGSSSRYKGVGMVKDSSRFFASIKIGGKKIHLGYFGDESEAALAYNEAAIKYHGEFARLNIIEQ